MIRPLALVGLATLGLAGLEAAPRAQQVFRAGTDLVLLTVTATRGAHAAATGLRQGDFEVFEDGAPQTIALFAHEPQPISLSILIDASSSMDNKLRVAQEAAVGFSRRLGPDDLAQVTAFSSANQIRQTFTNDIDLLERSIRETRANGSTALYSAIYIALNELNTKRRRQAPDEIRRQAIVVLSDGEDTTSLTHYEDLLELGKRSDVAVYAIGLRDKNRSARRTFNEADYVLRTLAQSTGGRVFFVTDVDELPQIYNQIADELATQYTIGFISTNTVRDGAWRQIAVRVVQSGVVARTKAGYFGPKQVP
jgi:Ca-activated chloride channel family protein